MYNNKIKKCLLIFPILVLMISIPVTYSKYMQKIDKTIIINARQPQYTVVMHSNNGEDETVEQEFTYGTSQTLQANTFTKQDYVFLNWNTSADGTGSQSYGDEQEVNNLTGIDGEEFHLYAQWTTDENLITITLDPSEGNVEYTTKSVNKNGTYGELPTPTREGYIFLGWSNVQDGYQQIEYLESTGTQYIDTGVPAGNTKGIYARLSSSEISTDAIYFGSKKGNGDTRFWIGNKNSQIYYGWNYNTYRSTRIYTNTIYDIKMNYLNDRKAIFNDEVIRDIGDSELASSNNSNIYIFAGNNGSANYYSKIKIYELKISNNESITNDFIPCIRRSDDEQGLCDIKNNAFYKNKGTGNFSCGSNVIINSETSIIFKNNHTLYAQWEKIPVITFDANGGTVNPASKNLDDSGTYGELPTPTREGYSFLGWSLLPKEYQRLEYIESTGTQYIDTEIPAGNEKGIYAKLSSSDISNDLIYFGSKVGSGDTRFWVGNNNSQIYYGWNSNTTRSTNISTDEIFEVRLNYLNDRKAMFNNEIIKNIGTTALSSSNNANIFIFAGNNYYSYYYSKIKLYELKISNKSKITNYFIPCYRKLDNEIGLYDLMTGLFYTNKGSGTFNIGDNYSGDYITSSSQVLKREDHTLYAQWKREPVITFEPNGGTVNPASKYLDNSGTYGSLPTPIREGYTFIGWSRLPSEYQEVEYIETNKNQYIDTGVIPNQDTGFDIDFLVKDSFTSSANTSGSIFGVRSSWSDSNKTGTNMFQLTTYSNLTSSFADGAMAFGSQKYASGMTQNERMTISLKNGVYTKPDGTEIQLDTTNFTAPNTMYLFMLRGFSNEKAGVKLYSFKMYDGNTLIRDYIPCYRKLDNVAGLYDLVNDVFYTNQGTGTFDVGENYNSDLITSNSQVLKREDHTLYAVWGKNPIVTFDANGGSVSPTVKTYQYNSQYIDLPTPERRGYRFLGWKSRNNDYILPDEYQEVEYIETNKNQYIDTGVIPNQDTGFDIDFLVKDSFTSSANTSGSIFGVRSSWSDSNKTGTNMFQLTTYSNITSSFADGAMAFGSQKYASGMTQNERMTISLRNGVYTKPDGTEIQLDTTNFTAPNTMYLFMLRGYSNEKAGVKLYSFKMYDGNTIIRDFIPCYRKNDNVIGLYDLVNNVFYTNLGTGTFEKGKDIINKYITQWEPLITNEDHTLYAQWEETIAVTLDPNGGTVNPSVKNLDNSGTYGELPTPLREGYTFLGWNKYLIPDEYQQVEYIQFNGNEYFDTGIVPTNHMIEVKYDFITFDHTEFIFGNSASNGYYSFSSNNFSSNYVYGTNGTEIRTGTRSLGINTIIYNDEEGSVRINDTVLGTGYNINSSSNLLIGKSKQTNEMLTGKIYYIKITDKSTNIIVKHLIPVYRKSDKTIGMYDLISEIFYTNQGSGAFSIGNVEDNYVTAETSVTDTFDHTLYAIWGRNPVVTFNPNGGSVSPIVKEYNYNSYYTDLPTPTREGYSFLGWSKYYLPNEYQQIEYIQFNGNEYFDTGIVPTNHMIEVKYDFLTFDHTEFIFGNSNSNGYYSFSSNNYSSNYVYGTNGTEIRTGTRLLGINTLIYNDEEGSVKINDAVLGTDYNIISSSNLLIGRSKQTNEMLTGKIYFIKITNKSINTIVKYLIPVYRKSDKTIGMYDLISDIFYTNQGSGAFSKGNNIESTYTYITSETKIIDNSNHTLYAIWGHKPTVTFDAGEGIVSTNSATYTYHSNYIDLPTPTREGYTFEGWSLLPEDYQQVEYIETTGTQYIDTGIYPNQNTGFYIDFSTTDTFSSSTHGTHFGTRDNSTSLNTLEYGTWTGASSTGYLFFWKSGSDYDAKNAAGLQSNVRQVASLRNGFYTNPDGEIIDRTTEEFNSTYSLILFARHYGSSINAYSKMKLYSFKLYNGDEIVRDYIPCYKKDNLVKGLYDIVNGVFYTNSGTGTFYVGADYFITSSTTVNIEEDHSLYANWLYNPVVTLNPNGGTVGLTTKTLDYEEEYGELPIPAKEGYSFEGWSYLPDGYQQIEYIETTGTQYIDTGIYPNQNTGFYIDFSTTDTFSSSTHGTHFGTRDNSTSLNSLEYGTWTGASSTGYLFFWKTGSDTNANNAAGLQPNVRQVASLRNGFYTNPSGEVIDRTSNIFTSTYSLILFARHYGSSINAYSKMKLYSFILYDGDNIVRNYIPCYRKSDKEVGLYDIANNEFYPNNGTGVLDAGPTSYVTSTSKVLIDYNHILYANYEKNPIITFNAGDGVVNPTEKTIDANSTYGELPTPTREGYTFDGWTLLPNEYQQVEYIETNPSSWTTGQYIDTGVNVTERTGFDIDFQISSNFNTTESGQGGWGEVFGICDARSGSNCLNDLELGTWTGVSSSGYFSYGNSIYHGYSLAAGMSQNNRMQISMHNRVFTNQNGDVTKMNTQKFTSQNTLYLFARNWLGTASALSKTSLYSFKLYDGNEIIRDFIPCYRKNDLEVGLYDVINDQFYSNQGTGSFQKGADMNEYITSSTKILNNKNHTLYAIWEPSNN